MRLAKFDAVQPIDNHPNALERPKLCTKTVLGRFLQDSSAQALKLGFIQPGWTPTRRYCTQRIDPALIEQRLPRIYGLPGYAHSERDFGRLLSFEQQSSRA